MLMYWWHTMTYTMSSNPSFITYMNLLICVLVSFSKLSAFLSQTDKFLNAKLYSVKWNCMLSFHNTYSFQNIDTQMPTCGYLLSNSAFMTFFTPHTSKTHLSRGWYLLRLTFPHFTWFINSSFYSQPIQETGSRVIAPEVPCVLLICLILSKHSFKKDSLTINKTGLTRIPSCLDWPLEYPIHTAYDTTRPFLPRGRWPNYFRKACVCVWDKRNGVV